MSATHPTLLTPRVLIPFIIVTLIWGSTWIVIRGQLGDVPASWSVCYRFLVAAIAMFGTCTSPRTAWWNWRGITQSVDP